MSEPRLLVVTPVRNEAVHLVSVVEAVAAQTRHPDLWLIVDDGSQDGTLAAANAAAERLPFLRVLRAPASEASGDNESRLVSGAEARAFNWALAQAELAGFTHVAKLDGDIELPADYFARVLGEFDRRPALGIAGGRFAEQRRGDWVPVATPPEHVPGAVKVYSSACFDAIGGIREHLGWDTIDETSARMCGFETGVVPGLVVRHLRPWGSVGGRLRGRARYGACAYGAGYPAGWVALRSLKMATLPPFGVSGAAFLTGYARAAAARAPRIRDRAYRRFIRVELKDRIRRKFPPARGVPQREAIG